jgi:hypothetical protein
MTPEALRQAAITLFGERGWMSRLAESLGVDRSSVSRWFAGLPVPGPVAAAVEAWLMLYKLTGLRPDELSMLDRIKPSSDAGEPPIHRFRK